MRRKTVLHDAIDFVAVAMHSLVSDNFTPCFRPILPTELNGSGVFYVFSLLIRYLILLPLRVAILFTGLAVFSLWFFLALLFKAESHFEKAFFFFIKIFMFCFGARVKNYGKKVKLDEPHIFVANHTSFLDFLVLSSHRFVHASVGEAHGGLFGLLFRIFLTKNGSLLFRRSDRSDRGRALRLIKEHVRSNRASMLIFPEGTCVNNKHSVMFQKGAFELDATVCPVAIKYRKNLLDPYWNTTKHTFFIHCLYLMSRWKMEVEVFWLPPVKKGNESASEFALRVNELISKTADLKITRWNGYFKSAPVLKDRELLREAFKSVYLDHKKKKELIINNFYNKEKKERYKSEYAEVFGEKQSGTDSGNRDITRSVFYDLNYKTYLDLVLKEYMEFKSNPEKLEKIREEKKVGFDESEIKLVNNYMRKFVHGAHPLCVCNFEGLKFDDTYEYKAKDKTIGNFNLVAAYKCLSKYY